MSQQWYFSRGGRNFGPIEAEKLWAMARSGELTPQDRVVPVGSSQWMPAANVWGLFSSAAAPSGRPPGGPPSSGPPQPGQPPALPTRPPMQQPMMQPPRAAQVVPMAAAMPAMMYQQPPQPAGPLIMTDADDTPYARMQIQSYRAEFLDLSPLIVVPATILMILHILLAVLTGLGGFAVLITVGNNPFMRVSPLFYVLVAFGVSMQVLQFRIARDLTKGKRNAAYGLTVFMILYALGGAFFLMVPVDDLPEQALSPHIIGGVNLGIVCLLQLPALIGTVCEWRKFE